MRNRYASSLWGSGNAEGQWYQRNAIPTIPDATQGHPEDNTMIVTLGVEMIGADDVHQHLRTVVSSRRP